MGTYIYVVAALQICRFVRTNVSIVIKIRGYDKKNTRLFQNSDESFASATVPGKFPLEDELELLVQQPTPSPVPSQVYLYMYFDIFSFIQDFL